jgi:hypothetical protein
MQREITSVPNVDRLAAAAAQGTEQLEEKFDDPVSHLLFSKPIDISSNKVTV